MDAIYYVAIVEALIAIVLLIYSAKMTVQYNKVIAFVKAAGMVLSGDVKEVKPEELLRQIITQLEVIGESALGRKLADELVHILIPKAPESIRKDLQAWADEPWDSIVSVKKDKVADDEEDEDDLVVAAINAHDDSVGEDEDDDDEEIVEPRSDPEPLTLVPASKPAAVPKKKKVLKAKN